MKILWRITLQIGNALKRSLSQTMSEPQRHETWHGLFGLHPKQVITTMVIRQLLDDRTYCDWSAFTHLDPDTMTNSALEATVSSSGKHYRGSSLLNVFLVQRNRIDNIDDVFAIKACQNGALLTHIRSSFYSDRSVCLSSVCRVVYCG